MKFGKIPHMNTPQKGSVRYIVFKEGETWYAVGLEFNIVESGDDPNLVLLSLFEAMQGYVESCRKVKGARVGPLNQKADKEYEDLWKTLNSKTKKAIPSPFEISTFGVHNV
jgi:hypothetical protein